MWNHLFEKLNKLIAIGEQQIALSQQTLKAVQALQKTAHKVAIHFGSQPKGEENMALSLPVGQTDQYYINSDAPLLPGQVIAVVAADATIVLTADATPAVDPKTKIQSAASGSVSIGPSPVIGTPVTVTATLTAADGTTIIDTETDTVTPVAVGAKKIGILFEDASVNPSPAG